jgi:hypothetical protein
MLIYPTLQTMDRGQPMATNDLMIDDGWTEHDDAQAVVITERGKPLVALAGEPKEIFVRENGVPAFLAECKAIIETFEKDLPDISTPKGEAALKSFGRRIALTAGAAEKAGLDYCKELDKNRQSVLGQRKLIETTLKGWQERIMRPLNEWKAKEKARRDEHESHLENVAGLTWFGEGIVPTSDECQKRIDRLKLAECRDWQEFTERARKTIDGVFGTLGRALTAALQREAEAAELEKLRREAADRERADREKRIADEAAETARKAAEKKAQDEAAALARKQEQERIEAKRKADEKERQARIAEEERVAKISREREASERRAKEDRERAVKAEQDKQAAEKRSAELLAKAKVDADQYEQERIERERRARLEKAEAEERARESERKRIEEEQVEAARVESERVADEKHRHHIEAEALDALVKLLGIHDAATRVLKAIRQGNIPHVRIDY